MQKLNSSCLGLDQKDKRDSIHQVSVNCSCKSKFAAIVAYNRKSEDDNDGKQG